MKYYCLVNVELILKKYVNVELRWFNVYFKYLNRRLSLEILRFSFIWNLKLMMRILRDCECLGFEELEYLLVMVLDLVDMGSI